MATKRATFEPVLHADRVPVSDFQRKRLAELIAMPEIREKERPRLEAAVAALQNAEQALQLIGAIGGKVAERRAYDPPPQPRQREPRMRAVDVIDPQQHRRDLFD